METAFGITGKGYVLIASDTTAVHSIVKVKTDVDKIKELSPYLAMAVSGEPGALRFPSRSCTLAHFTAV